VALIPIANAANSTFDTMKGYAYSIWRWCTVVHILEKFDRFETLRRQTKPSLRPERMQVLSDRDLRVVHAPPLNQGRSGAIWSAECGEECLPAMLKTGKTEKALLKEAAMAAMVCPTTPVADDAPDSSLIRFLGVHTLSFGGATYTGLAFERMRCTLWDVIRGGQPEMRVILQPLKARVHVAACVARAMEHMHRRGVFHGDIASTNVMLDHNDRDSELSLPLVAKLIDFGLATCVDSSGDHMPHMSCESAEMYAAREHNCGDAHTSLAKDVKMFGTLLAVLVLRPPLRKDPFREGSEWLCHLNRMCLEGPETAFAVDPCERELVRLVRACTRWRPQDRPDAASVHHRLRRIQLQLEL